MKAYGRTSVSEFMGDRIVFRNLVPMDAQLPPLAAFYAQAGLPSAQVPRKTDPGYARAIVYLLRQARAADAGSQGHGGAAALKRLVFIGDTRMLDGTAYSNLCQQGGWPGLAFIGSETTGPAAVEIAVAEGGQPLYLSNRWAALEDFDRYCRQQGMPVDDEAVVVIDLDKTTLGARGRNGHNIDRARVQAVRNTVAELLGGTFDAQAFQSAYDLLNQPEFHKFTADNQDYLAYICLVLGSGLEKLEAVVAGVRSETLKSFEQFIHRVEARQLDLPPALAAIHADIYANVLAGDPTPFKPFRRNEYLTTISRFGCLDDQQPVEALLKDEIVITQEVRQLALEWRRRGALLFALSDKPDEASIPTPELAQQGYQPLHRAITHALGT